MAVSYSTTNFGGAYTTRFMRVLSKKRLL